ncbi:MAG: Z1 domain-containing protein [Elusimicrobia bacterium]|nr:Z1 domain-containing protein [Elusimicrobiota bacterium]
MNTFVEYKSVVEYLIRTKRMKPAKAIREAQVPVQFVDQIREYLAGPVVIQRPSLLVDREASDVLRCPRFSDGDAQPYFAGLKNYLLNYRKWDRNTVDNLAETSNDLLVRLPSPSQGGFKSRGLVVGHIQSGKTANMAALISRAADSGYKLVVVFSGLYKDLRSQTQRRFDQEITGAPDFPEEKPAVEHDPGILKWGRLTRSGLNGDFARDNFPLDILNPSIPKLAVVKKNVKVLERLIDWLKCSNFSVENLPTLIIDDESDLASINTNYGKVDDDGEPIEPSKTNLRIREFLDIFPKCVYVGFTATPFANALIDAREDSDLYPKDFIAVLREPQGYLGPRQLFGLGMLPSDLSPDTAEPIVNVIRHITPEQIVEMDHLGPGRCPELLSEALLSFILSSSARMQRGQGDKHFSMLVHSSHLTAEHNAAAAKLADEIVFLKAQLQRPAKFPDLIKRASAMWEKDFLPTTEALPECKKMAHDFDSVWRYAKDVVDSLELKILNVGSPDELDYASHTPKRYVVVGGNRLSRGLTLEGLSISVFLRDTNTYDTLLQMGRWFGFRPRYHDLTRIYVEETTAELFADLARVEADLRADLMKYAQEPNPPTPVEVLPRIRFHPILSITAPNKMGAAGQVDSISFQGKQSQTVRFPFDQPEQLRENQEILREWLKGLGKPKKSISRDGTHLWKDIPAAKLLELVKSYKFSTGAPDVNSYYLSKYIENQNSHGELTKWDVVIPRGNRENGLYTWAPNLASRKVERTRRTINSIRVLKSDGDVDEWRREFKRQEDSPELGSIFLYVIDPKPIIAGTDRKDIPDTIGLLFNFPQSKKIVPAQYVSQAR